MGKNIITFASVTYAIKARKLLNRAGVSAKLVKVSAELTKGCTHGVEIFESSFFDTINILKTAGIEYSVYSS